MGRPIVLLDNLDSTGRRGMLHSSTLAAVLTAPIWSDRLVRTSRKPDLPNRALWLFTGNNPRLSMELARRCVRCRLDPGMDRPWLRTGFRHPDLRSWVLENRPALVHALLVMVAAWVAEGRPEHPAKLGSFESWSAVVGGILDVAQIPGFLGNLDELYEAADAEGQMWREFTEAWWEAFSDRPKRPSELNALCEAQDLMVAVRGSGSPKSQVTSLGLALDGARDRVFGRYRVRLVSDRGPKKGRRYALAVVPSPTGGPAGRGDVGAEGPHTGNVTVSEGCTSDGVAQRARPPERPPSKSCGTASPYEGKGDLRGPFNHSESRSQFAPQAPRPRIRGSANVPQVPHKEESTSKPADSIRRPESGRFLTVSAALPEEPN